MDADLTIVPKPADWLMSHGRGSKDTADLLTGFCQVLRRNGVPVDRSTIGATLLHPITQSSYTSWTVEDGADIHWFIWTPENLEQLRNSPIELAYDHGEGVLLNLDDKKDRERFGIGIDLHKEGYRQYMTLALPFSDGTFNVFTCATRTSGGFTQGQIRQIEQLSGPLAAILELLVLKSSAKTLLDTYVGERAGKRILKGDIHRGDGSFIPAVILFSDLRGFTRLSNALDERQLLQKLNVYFEALTDAIADNGGEVLKFIGDAILAVFPIDGPASRAADQALEAALTALKKRHEADWPKEIDFGLALHYGDVFFGNVGGKTRLDFTVMGRQVNLASRIEGLCAQLDENLLVSAAFADISKARFKQKGSHLLKGFSKPTQIFAPE